MPRRPRNTPRISDEERTLFREAVADAKPLPPDDKIQVPQRRPKPVARSREADEREVLAALVAAIPDGELETGDELEWRIPGVQANVLRKLRRGQYRITREIDLHGLNANDAKPAVALFIHESRQQGLHCVRVIHGKGKGSRTGQSILKQLVGGWLRRHDGVLAYVSARPEDGGTGALLVLLRKLA